MSPKEKKSEPARTRVLRSVGATVVLVIGIVLIVTGTQTMYKTYNVEKKPQAKAPPPNDGNKAPPADLADNGAAEEESSEDIGKQFGDLKGTPEETSEDISKQFGDLKGTPEETSGEDVAKQFGDLESATEDATGKAADAPPATEATASPAADATGKPAERPFTMISDVQLTIDTTFSGVIREGGVLVSQYDRSDTRGKRACPT